MMLLGKLKNILSSGRKKMRKLALDVGTKRIGLSVSDPTNTIAQPLGYITRSNIQKEAEQIRSYVGEFEVEEIIVGLPLNLEGKFGEAAKKISAYADCLEEEIEIPVRKWDERFTTKQAEEILIQADVSRSKRKEVIDSLAAVLILQNYLDTKK